MYYSKIHIMYIQIISVTNNHKLRASTMRKPNLDNLSTSCNKLVNFIIKLQKAVAEISVGGGGRGRLPHTFRKIGSLSDIFGFVGILKTIEYTEI